MEFKIRSSIITTLVLISISLILSEPVRYGFQPFQRRSGSQGRESGPQHFVMPIMRNSQTDKHHILKENYVQKPFLQQERQSPEPKENLETPKNPEVVTENPAMTTPTTHTPQGPQGRALSDKSNKTRMTQVVKTYHAIQTLKTTTTTRKPKFETTTVHMQNSLSAPTTTISPLKLTTKEIPEIRHGSQDEVDRESETAKTQGGSGTQPIATRTQGAASKLKNTKVQDKKEAKLKKKHRRRHHHSGHLRNHHKHQGHHDEGRHSSNNQSHKRHHLRHGLDHPRHFHGIKSSSRGGPHSKSHHSHHRHHHGGNHAQEAGTHHGSRVKREEPMQTNEVKGTEVDNEISGKTGASGESTSLEGNEMDDHAESGSISLESSETGRSNMDPLDVLDVAPGPYLQQNSEEDDSEETGRIDAPVPEPQLNSWSEYVENQRSSLLADPNKKKLYKHRGYVPIMEPEDHFKQVDQQYKEKNDRMIAFHNLHNFIRQRRMKFKIPDTPPAKATGARIFVDLMSDME